MDIITTLCLQVCEEFFKLGFKKDSNPRTLKESFNIVKQADGQWFKSTKTGLHDAATIILLDLNVMPNLKIMTDKIDELDSEIKKEGGRIFISESLVYKIKKGTLTPLLVGGSSEKIASGRYRKLCDEIVEYGLEQDRFRSEETYILTKTANGEWSMSSSHENYSGIKKILNIAKMSQLKLLAIKLNKVDLKFQLNGGRIFITPTRIYRLNNKIEVEIKF